MEVRYELPTWDGFLSNTILQSTSFSFIRKNAIKISIFGLV